MTDQLSFDFEPPKGSADSTLDSSEGRISTAAEVLGSEPSSAITEAVPIETPPATMPAPAIASDDDAPASPPPSSPWPKAPQWASLLTRPTDIERPKTLLGCVAWLHGELGAKHQAAKEIAGAAHTVIRVAHGVFDLKDQDLPADPPSLRPYLRNAMPAGIKVSRKRFENAKSLVTSLLILTGWVSPHYRSNAALSPYWINRLAGSGRQLPAGPLPAFFRYCDREGVPPNHITGEIVERYEAWLVAETLDLRPRHTSNAILTCWRRFKGAQPDWPPQPLALVSRRVQKFKPPASFPASFTSELEGYLEKLRRPGPFERAYGRPKSEIAINHARRYLLRAATLLMERGTPVAEVTGLAALVTPTAFQTILMALHEEGATRFEAKGEKVEWARTAYDMASYLKLMAQRWVKPGVEILTDLEEMARCIPKPRNELSERVQAQLAEFGTAEDREELFKLSGRAFEMADRMLRDGDTRGAAKLHETAVALAIVVRHLLRRRDLARLDIEQHLARDRKGRVTQIGIRTNKTSYSVRAEIAPDLADRLDHHIRVLRPHILGNQGSTALFPAPNGTSRCPSTLANQMVRLVARQLGKKFTAHLARHLAVDIILDDDPKNMALAQRSLGHKTQTTTESKYGSRATLAAQRQYQRLILGALPTPKPRAPRKGAK